MTMANQTIENYSMAFRLPSIVTEPPQGPLSEGGFTCEDCQQPIPDGEKMWSITLTHEALEDDVLQVYGHSIGLYVWCETCAANRDFKNFVVPKKV